MFRYALCILHTISDIAMGTLFCFVRAQPLCFLTKWSGHLSRFSQDGLERNEVILSCSQLIPNSKRLCLKREKTAAKDFTCAKIEASSNHSLFSVTFLLHEVVLYQKKQAPSTGVYSCWIPEGILLAVATCWQDECYGYGHMWNESVLAIGIS